jgi:hypothetical protein
MGAPPFLDAGEAVMWRYRDHVWAPGSAETATPMRVVRDDERGLVAWLAPGTVLLTKRYADGRDLRDVPLERRFRLDVQRIQARTRWRGAGILCMAPAGRPWSVWLFWDVPDVASTDGWVFEGWYVNLENAHLRAGAETFTGDHVLDLWIEADGTIHLKDDDELDAAVEQGRAVADVAAMVRHNADLARAAYARGEWSFDEEWARWRPDPAWMAPSLPADERWRLDLT